MCLVQVAVSISEGGGICLEKEGVTDRGGKVIDEARGDCHEVGGQKEKGLFGFRLG
jgi:hypothetical protein